MRPSLKKKIVGGGQGDGGLSIKWFGCLSVEGHLWGAEVKRVPRRRHSQAQCGESQDQTSGAGRVLS